MDTNNKTELTNSNEMSIKKCASFRDEKILRIIAVAILIAGSIATLILLFTLTFISVQKGYYSEDGTFLNSSYTEKIFNASGLAISLATLFSSVLLWAFLRVISNISISLKEMKFRDTD